MPDHPIVHIEFASNNPKAEQQFYGDVFGWQLHTDDTFNYHMFQANPGPAGGFVGVSDGTESGGMRYAPGEVLVYISTDDIDATLARIEEHGGKTELPRTEIPGTGWFAVFTDPQGTRAALFTAAPRQE
jgi:uncharacterized protein